MIDTRLGIAGVTLALVALIACAPTAQAPSTSGEPGPPESSSDPADLDPEVGQIVERFRNALATGDSAAIIELLHPEVRVYESGHAETLREYRSGHLAADIEFSRSVDSETLEETLVSGETMALYLREYAVSGTFRDREVDARGTETLVLVPVNESWRIRHIHWSSR